MAQRFGGQFSPSGNKPEGTDAARPMAPVAKPSSRFERMAGFLGVTSLAFFIPGFQGDQRQLMLSLVAGGLIIAASALTRSGVKAQMAYDARKVARRPAIPRKIFGAVAMAAALAVGGMIHQSGVLYPALFALVGLGLHLFAFGPDPLSNKGMEGVDQFQTDRVARAVDEAEAHLSAMKDAILRAGERSLEGRVEKFSQTARGLFRTVETDPGDLTAARKFLSVYLMGARDATVKFADIYAHNRDAKARADYEALLTDLETTFAQRTTALLSNGHTDLDVEISVLRDRLKLEN
jgi:5-bromo-4-chloroindolyl phosphate hydrolysis protein